jgi:hypothetical protein
MHLHLGITIAVNLFIIYMEWLDPFVLSTTPVITLLLFLETFRKQYTEPE